MLTKAQYLNFTKFGYNYILKNEKSISLVKNESGFVRITIPLPAPLPLLNGKIQKIRFNYWSPETELVVQDESIHTHPSVFESFILNGGYTHRIYDESSEGTCFELYRINKMAKGRITEYLGKRLLRIRQDHTVKRGDIVFLPTQMIHKIISNSPKTLTINAVFDEDEHNDKSYNVYASKKEAEINTERNLFVDKKKQIIDNIKQILVDYA